MNSCAAPKFYFIYFSFIFQRYKFADNSECSLMKRMKKKCVLRPRLQKLSYTMRTVDPCSHQQGTLKRFDTAVSQSLERELGISLEDHQCIQATLPVSMGGFRWRRVETYSQEPT